jgi:Ca-activated chloride channel homolog
MFARPPHARPSTPAPISPHAAPTRAAISPPAAPTRARRFLRGLGVVLGSLGAGLLVANVYLPIAPASGQSAPVEERDAAARLEARSEDGNGAQLPLVAEALTVRFDDGHVAETFDHTFQNESKARLEGAYKLVVGEGASATGFAYWNGAQKIVGEIFEREAAQQVYEALTGLRRDPGLLEQAGEGVFSFRVFPIEPGERKRVQVSTSRWLPRRGAAIEYRARLTRPDARVEIAVNDARGVASLDSPSHEIAIDRLSDTSFKIVAQKAKGAPDEFVLRYEPREAPLTLRAAVHHDAGQPAFFSATIAAPAGKSERRPTDVTLVLDRSGSMAGASIESARAAAKAVVERLQATDRVNVVAFDDKVDALYDAPRPLGDEVRREALDYIAKIREGGGTDIARALKRAFEAQKADERPDVVLFLTDGQSDGPSAVKIAEDDKSGTRVFTVGIGTGVDKALLSRIASLRRGRFTFVADPRAVKVEFPKVLSQLEAPAVSNLRLRLEGGRLERAYPDVVGDLFAGDEVRVFGRATGAGPVKVVLEGDEGGKPRRFEAEIDAAAAAARPWVARGWARSRVDDLLEVSRAKGESDELKNEAIELGLAYGLVTPFTSFLAVPESELTEAAKQAVGSMRERRKAILAAHKDAAAVSRLNMPPGDPVLKVKAPRDARRVTALFPFGLAQDLFFDAFAECWMTRFLVPVGVPDGEYDVPVVVVHADGKVTATTAHYTIDSRSADVDVDARPSPQGVELRVTLDEAAGEVRAAPVADPSNAATLTADADRRTFRGRLSLPPGRHQLRIVVADLARNEAERLVDVEVAP